MRSGHEIAFTYLTSKPGAARTGQITVTPVITSHYESKSCTLSQCCTGTTPDWKRTKVPFNSASMRRLSCGSRGFSMMTSSFTTTVSAPITKSGGSSGFSS